MDNTINLNQYLKSVIDADLQPVVICNLEHTVIYMNTSAIKRYAKWGGSDLIGRNLMDCHNEDSQKKMIKCLEWFEQDTENNIVFTFHHPKDNADVYVVALRDELGRLIGYYEKHESRNLENTERYCFN